METQTFETSKGTLLAIRLPEGAINPMLIYPDRLDYVVNDKWDYPLRQTYRLPPGDWKEIGLWGSVSEEKAKEVVPDSIRLQDVFENRYFLYTREWAYLARTALESLQSLLETGILLRNPKPHPADIHPTSRAHYDKLSDEWQTAEAQVWKHFYLIFKTK